MRLYENGWRVSRNFLRNAKKILDKKGAPVYIRGMKKIIGCLLALCASLPLFSTPLPREYYALRDCMYDFAKPVEEMEADFNSYVEKARSEFSGCALDFVLARYEYIMGRAYYYAKDEANASLHYDRGMDFAGKAVEADRCADSLLIYAENISANCTVKSTGWVIKWGAKIAGLDRKILKMEPSSAAALYMLNAQDVYAPKPFCDWSQGVKNMSAMLDDESLVMGRDDEFNVKSAIGYALMMKKDAEGARFWFGKSLKIYPGNKYVKGLLASLDEGEK